MTFPASQIAFLINGKVEGDPNVAVNSFGKIEEAREGQLSFLANLKYEDYLYSTGASVIILNENYELKQPVSATLIRVPDAYSAFATLLTKYQEIMQQQLQGVQEPAYIAKSATYGEQVFIGAFAYLGENVRIGNNTKIYPNAYIGNNVTIGDNCVIHPGVKIYHDCQIGNHVSIHAGTVVGSDGFGFAPQADGSFKKVPQIGNVVIHDYVEIGANATIDRATIGSTVIKSGAKLDNLIQIAHNVEVGNSTVIAAQAGVSGSTKIGNGVMIGGQAGIVGHIQLGDGAKVNAQSGVSKSIEAGKAVTGSPAHDYTAALRSQALSRNLPMLEKRIKELEILIRQLLAENV
ncbi:MAG: UDP-3-O-(3-hydroxymyristoyl)glucosamine N-acyltransferase [Sphingobacteriales bacterium SCN 48-20]|jgi:UDP-3-O-[3-hydroxymyristoyl] glucosamine N-acyltransferase|uniref:UDP-3-O-(3-hydroxymyristoyl)glucosamine N-acyltransferase n=1 Tax=Terrimonas ferruginea TaxID=249 RepID=UPI0003F8CB0C|nr:UDP-3-O-(3-hydroxymyristoyl)glucosamine N-acyltransferase [Terrimonas ferruginea]MBN8781545.1 UDP-3-O-(3-hydroxymyristoyl)glucosamine N-acyltransferase [Terrimonas ferruginea]ODT94878.1 MAG: UDP-3-O-(3-hydroxymyristoyl)glucosamine N-acyltransferase [Sphingobacteriales bacterium SCN 48-20]OJW44708.1 MAG: UDP-3-O-(3-hydroxymyristoyl)glucosamine N-acyltransferase [Sphingobacteriales bacterium 48-107]